jgi:Beige/BEACH domain
LLNNHKLDLGYTPEGEDIDDVGLPKWAEEIQDFSFIMRAALESEFVALSLNNWIDLTFGCKQKG